MARYSTAARFAVSGALGLIVTVGIWGVSMKGAIEHPPERDIDRPNFKVLVGPATDGVHYIDETDAPLDRLTTPALLSLEHLETTTSARVAIHDHWVTRSDLRIVADVADPMASASMLDHLGYPPRGGRDGQRVRATSEPDCFALKVSSRYRRTYCYRVEDGKVVPVRERLWSPFHFLPPLFGGAAIGVAVGFIVHRLMRRRARSP